MADPPAATPAARTRPPCESLALARFLYSLRGARRTFISERVLGEPGWDMLLDLYIAEAEGRSLSVTAAGIGSRSPSATGLRYVAILEAKGLAVRERDGGDGRRWFVRLTEDGRRAMDAVLACGLCDLDAVARRIRLHCPPAEPPLRPRAAGAV